MVVAYLAPSEEEPMALWKIHLQRGDFIDLDEGELQRALTEVHQTHASQPRDPTA
jgi:hypothetical protein